jgi:hypothetical protein
VGRGFVIFKDLVKFQIGRKRRNPELFKMPHGKPETVITSWRLGIRRFGGKNHFVIKEKLQNESRSILMEWEMLAQHRTQTKRVGRETGASRFLRARQAEGFSRVSYRQRAKTEDLTAKQAAAAWRPAT